MTPKIIGKLVLSACLLGSFQIASADWESGPCPSPAGPAPCIEYDDGDQVWHFNGEGEHAGIWHGPDGDDTNTPPDVDNSFEFCGTTVLSCEDTIIGPIEVSCNLCLSGQVRKCYDDDAETWRIGIRIVDGTPNPGDFFCNLITLGNFPWYANQDDLHEPYNEDCSTGIAVPGPLVGSIGLIDVAPMGINGAHIHNVSYNNIDTFSFSNELVVYNSVTMMDEGTGCFVNGNLELQATDETLSINF